MGSRHDAGPEKHAGQDLPAGPHAFSSSEAPPDRPEARDPLDQEIQQEAGHPDQEHRRHDQIVALPRVARVDDEVAEAGVDGDHLRRHHHDPGDAESDPKARQNLREGCGEDDPRQQCRARQAEVAPGVAVHRRDPAHAVHGRDQNREERSQKDKKNGGRVADPEEHDRDRDPGQRADGAKELDDGIGGASGPGMPAEEDADRNADDERRPVSGGNAQERIPRVPEEETLSGELHEAARHGPGRGKDIRSGNPNGHVPEKDEGRGRGGGQEDGFETAAPHIL